jgi:hypothetical protein
MSAFGVKRTSAYRQIRREHPVGIDRVWWIERAIARSNGARLPKLIEARAEPTD